ncbi:protealysin inhibitor emfourin [Roseateles koreensis]|uniref:Uncharacterized protein n=1 Tax=Roseateles koreensis TaxID=2987526 RepID=A0ABT5KP90_9BURK|nr:protealysin inhibitor emfourin [Roseateles koreensis]MDC8784721.1 hypothetical protein [Roseateles koreensis]
MIKKNFSADAALLDSERLTLERLGGLAGFGLPGSRLRSRGELVVAELSAADKLQVAALFAAHQQTSVACAIPPDAFRYRLTRHGEPARAVSIELQEAQVPSVLRDCVQDELL